MRVDFDVWDIPGKADLAPLNRMYIRDCHSAIVVYDVTNPESLRSAERWIEEVKEAGPSECLILMAGNKMDAPQDKQKVPLSDGMAVARKNGVIHCQEVSAVSKEGLNNLFLKVAQLCYDRKD